MQDNTTVNVSASGNILIDALLSGVKWAEPTVTYAFPTSISQYGPGYTAANGFGANFQPLSVEFQDNVLSLFDEISKLTLLRFVPATPETATLRFGRFDDPYNSAYGALPSGSDLGGDMWFANNENPPGEPGNGVMHITRHELGHALGLTHPHDGSVKMPTAYDINAYSAMSYKNYIGDPQPGIYNKGHTSWEQSAPILDIQALQYMYGANFATNATDNVYSFSPTNGEMFINGVSQGAVAANVIFRAIWDGGGNDTYDFSNYKTDQTIDLNPGMWSTFSASQLAANSTWYVNGFNVYSYEPGNIANPFLYNNDLRSLIENVKTGEGRDSIKGNKIDNTIFSGAGDDTIYGGEGNDTIDGGSHVDTAVFGGARSAYTVTQTSTGVFQITGADGTDQLTGVEFAKFDDQTLRLLPGDGVVVDFNATPSSYMGQIRDFDGNNLAGLGTQVINPSTGALVAGSVWDGTSGWSLVGSADVNGSGLQAHILFNNLIGRWAEVSTELDGKSYFSNHGWAGGTRIVGIYIDPEVTRGNAVQGGPNDSQRRFQNDLFIGNIKSVLGAGDYDHDGFQEVYFGLTDGTAYLHALMWSDGNIQYANYQSKQQVQDYMTANDVPAATWSNWFPASAAPPMVASLGLQSAIPDAFQTALFAGSPA